MDLPIKCGPPTREYLENTVYTGPWTTFGPGTLRGRAERPATTVWTRSAKPARSQPKSGEETGISYGFKTSKRRSRGPNADFW